MINITSICLPLLFIMPFISYLIVLPGVREKRIVTTVVFAFVILEGGALVASLYYPSWAVGNEELVSPFRAQKTERVHACVGVNVGLQHLNVSMRIVDVIVRDPDDVTELVGTKFNDEFDLSSASSMLSSLVDARERGLPYPMLAVLECFTPNRDAFDWGRHYRQAGHYAHAAVCLSISLWMISVLLLLFLPHYFCIATAGCGLASLLSVSAYLILSPQRLAISFVGLDGRKTELEMACGWCFYLILSVGIISTLVGLTLHLLQQFSLYTLSTFLECYLDETVSRKKQPIDPIPHISLGSLEYMQSQKKTLIVSGKNSENSASSSGIGSRNSLSNSFESIHDDAMDQSPVHLAEEELSPGVAC